MTRLLIFFVAITVLISCSKTEKTSGEKEEVTAEVPGKSIYTRNCKLCHGADGTLGLSGAANLKISALSTAEKIDVITNGRKGMAAWKGQLTPDEIKLVADYIETLKQ